MPQVLGAGYGWVQQALGRQGLLHMPLAVVLLLPFARILATGLSIGSGGSGGIFGPGIVIGAFVGAGTWRLLELGAPAVPASPVSFVIVGMMACFGSISRVPLAVMIMAAEMTSSLAVLAPAMIAVGLATLVVRRTDATIYRSQLRSREDSPAHRLQFGLPLLSNVRVADVQADPRLVVPASARAGAALRLLDDLSLPGAPVVDAGGVFAGTVDRLRLESAADPSWPVERVTDVTAPSVQAAAALDVALEALSQSEGGWVTVLDSAQRVTGVFGSADLIRGYRRALRQNTTRLSMLAGNAEPVELQVAEDAPVAGRSIREAGLPAGTIVVTVARERGLLFGDPQTVLEPGDVVSALARPESVPQLRRALGADDGPIEPGVPPEDGPVVQPASFADEI